MKLSKISTLILLLLLGKTFQINSSEEQKEKSPIRYNALHFDYNTEPPLLVGADVWNEEKREYITTFDKQVIKRLSRQIAKEDAQAAKASHD